MSVLPPDPDLARLRKLLEDAPAAQVETAAADGTETDFYFSNPPALADPAVVVSVNGTPQVLGTHYTISAGRDRVIFALAPVAGAQVAMRYSRQTWPDDELAGYLAEAAQDWPAGVGRVYRAAIYALDSLLIGSATALNFGAGAESFDVASVHDRLERLRATFAAELTRQGARPGVLVPVEPVPLPLP